MTNTIAIALVIVILALFLVDQVWLQWHVPLTAARLVDGLIEHLSIWR